MMYLVLTALLALNVSAEILRSFELIAESLHASTENTTAKNTRLGGDIKDAVSKEVSSGNKKNENILKEVDEVRNKTDEVIKYLDDQIVMMGDSRIGKLNPETHKYDNESDTENNFRYWMKDNYKDPAGNEEANSGRGSGEAFRLKDRLNGYVNWASEFQKRVNPSDKTFRNYPLIAIDPRDDASIDKNADIKTKTWEYMVFHGSPVLANIAMLQKFKNDVRVLESQLLEMLRLKLNVIPFKIDSIIPMDAPYSQQVAAGMPFETKLFVTMSSKQIKPKFASGSGALKVDADGNAATLRVIASAGVIPAGKSEGEQGYSATISVPKSDGTLQNLTITKRFKVRKPEVVITSAAINNMYQNCLNEINVDVPALGDLYNPVITASEAQAVGSRESRRKWAIIPTGRKTVLNVASNTNGQIVKVGDVAYTVIPPPKPNLLIFVNGQRYDGVTPISRANPVEVRVVPDENFARALPKDARYQIVNAKLKAQIGLGAPQDIAAAQTSNVVASPSLQFKVSRDVPAGTTCFVQIERIARNNFNNAKIEEAFTTFNLTLKFSIR